MGLRKERNANLLLKGYQGLNLATHKDNAFIVILKLKYQINPLQNPLYFLLLRYSTRINTTKIMIKSFYFVQFRKFTKILSILYNRSNVSTYID